MVEIKDANGKVISRSRNLRGLREYCGNNLAERVTIQKSLSGDGTGTLTVDFRFGQTCTTDFASYAVLCRSLLFWRNLAGTTLCVGGAIRGYVHSKNEWLLRDAC